MTFIHGGIEMIIGIHGVNHDTLLVGHLIIRWFIGTWLHSVGFIHLACTQALITALELDCLEVPRVDEKYECDWNDIEYNRGEDIDDGKRHVGHCDMIGDPRIE